MRRLTATLVLFGMGTGGTLSTVALASPPVVGPIDAREPVPVVVEEPGERVLLREGYTVPPGKLLVVEDASVTCRSNGPFSASASLYVRTPAESCLEPTFISQDSGVPVCPTRIHYLGEVSVSQAVAPTIFDGGSGRRLSVLIAEGAKLTGACQGAGGSSSIIGGTGRLVDSPE